MKPERETEFLDLIRAFNRRGIRYLIIGRRAVILYGAPVLTADHDLWIHPEDKRKALHLLQDDLGFELSHPPDTKRPIVTGYSGMRRYDLFFYRRVKTFESESVEFETCHERSVIREDTKQEVHFRIPSIDDLIRLKKVREPNVKDEQDIAYLLEAKRLWPKQGRK